MKTLRCIVACIAVATTISCNDGIIALDGYEHAVVICGEAVVINHGHEYDPQVKELLALAEVECAKLNKEGE